MILDKTLLEREYKAEGNEMPARTLVDFQLSLADKIGQDFFETCATHLNEFIQADITLIGRLDKAHTSLTTIALSDKTGILKNISYSLEKTPCEIVSHGTVCIYEKGVAEIFSEDVLLKQLNASGYVGVPIRDANKKPLGVMVSLFKESVPDAKFIQVVFELLSTRVQLEMDRMNMEQTLREQQDRYALAVKAGNFGVYDLSVKDDSAVVNDRIYEMIGYTPGEITMTYGLWISFIHPEDRPKREEYLKQSETNSPKRIYRLRNKSEDYRWVEARSNVIEKDAEGNILRIVGIIKDIHDQKVAEDQLVKAYEKEKQLNANLIEHEEQLIINQGKLISQMTLLQQLNQELSESETRWAYALESNGDGVIEWDMLSGVSTFSQRAQEIIGLDLKTKEQINKFYDYVHPASRALFKENFAISTKAPYSPFQLEVQILDRNNIYRWILFRGKVVKLTATGQPEKMVGTVTDLSEQKGIQKELTIYEEMIKQNHSAILFTDMNGSIEFMNAAAISLFEYNEHEIIGKNFSTLIDIAVIGFRLKDDFKGQQEFKTKTDKRIITQLGTSLLYQDGEPIGYVLNVTDITEKKRLEDEVVTLTMTKLESELAAQRNQTEIIIRVQENEKEFLARELHDGVGQLLSLVKLYLEQLNTEADPKHQKKIIEITELVQHVVTDIKGITCGLMPLNLRNMGIESAITSLLEHYKRVSGHSIAINCKINLNDHTLDGTTSMHLYRIAQEAINNSVKYAMASSLTVMLMKLKNSINLLVEDDGRGFSFDSKINEENSFGLKTMVERAKLINSKFVINTTPGAGTVISVTIPINQNDLP